MFSKDDVVELIDLMSSTAMVTIRLIIVFESLLIILLFRVKLEAKLIIQSI